MVGYPAWIGRHAQNHAPRLSKLPWPRPGRAVSTTCSKTNARMTHPNGRPVVVASNETRGKAVQMKSIFKGALSALIVVLALSGLTATAALASGSPFVETKSATAVGEAWANLNGIVNPNGAATEYSFEY